MARQRSAPAAKSAPAQPWQERKQVGPPQQVLAVPGHYLLAAAVTPRAERAGKRGGGQPPAATMHRPAHVHHVGDTGIVAVALEVHDGGGRHRLSSCPSLALARCRRPTGAARPISPVTAPSCLVSG